MCGIAISRLHVNPFQFYDMIPVEYYYAILDHQERERLSIEMPIRTMWETAREIVYQQNQGNPYTKKLRSRKSLMTFSWENAERRRVQQPKKQTPNQMAHMAKALASAFQDKNKKK